MVGALAAALIDRILATRRDTILDVHVSAVADALTGYQSSRTGRSPGRSTIRSIGRSKGRHAHGALISQYAKTQVGALVGSLQVGMPVGAHVSTYQYECRRN